MTNRADDTARVTEQKAYVAVEVVSACYLNVLMLVIQQHDLDTDGLNVAMSLQTSVMWFGTMLLTPG